MSDELWHDGKEARNGGEVGGCGGGNASGESVKKGGVSMNEEATWGKIGDAIDRGSGGEKASFVPVGVGREDGGLSVGVNAYYVGVKMLDGGDGGEEEEEEESVEVEIDLHFY